MEKKVKLLYVGNRLSKYGYTPGVIETLGLQLEQEGFEIIYAGNELNKLKRFKEMIWKTLSYSKKVDYVLIDTYSTSAFWFALVVGLLCRILNVKYVPILHGGNLPARLKKSKIFSDLLFKKSYQNVAVSGYLHHYFNLAGYSSIVIPNNIDVNSYKFKSRNNIKPNILWVRSFHKDYNPNMAIDVFVKLKKEFPDATLTMVGPEKDSSLSIFKEYAEKKYVQDSIKITGKLSKPDWHKLSEECDIFINTTNYDNTPVSILEAMALGLPVVTTNVGGIPFLLDNGVNAILVEKNDSDSMSKEISKLLESSEYVKKLTSKALTKVSSFDWDTVKFEWIKLLK
jgi:glycosyltransferase involved in cell wall biosynthesis